MKPYTDGQIAVVTSTFTITDPVTDVVSNVDPTTVAFEYAIAPSSSPAGSTTTLTYTGASVPAVGQIVRVAEGVYVTELDTTGMSLYNNGTDSGTTTVKFELVSTGTGQTVSDPPGVFLVQPREL